MNIVQGTTPTIKYTFSTVDTNDISIAWLTIKQLSKTVIERDLSSAIVEEGSLSWLLTQEESLTLQTKIPATVYLDYLLVNGLRGAGRTVSMDIDPTGKNEVIGDG